MNSQTDNLRNFLEIPYDELEQINLEAKRKRESKENEPEIKEYYISYLKKEKQLKAVTVGFSD